MTRSRSRTVRATSSSKSSFEVVLKAACVNATLPREHGLPLEELEREDAAGSSVAPEPTRMNEPGPRPRPRILLAASPLSQLRVVDIGVQAMEFDAEVLPDVGAPGELTGSCELLRRCKGPLGEYSDLGLCDAIPSPTSPRWPRAGRRSHTTFESGAGWQAFRLASICTAFTECSNQSGNGDVALT